MRKQISTLLTVFGLASGTMSLVSLTQRLLAIELVSVFGDLLVFYRAFAVPIFSAIPDLLHYRYPGIYLDLWPISFLGSASYFYGAQFLQLDNLTYKHEKQRRWATIGASRWLLPFWTVLMGFSMMGILFLISSVALLPFTYFSTRSMDQRTPEHRETLELYKLAKRTALRSFLVVGASIIFFALNAYAPSI